MAKVYVVSVMKHKLAAMSQEERTLLVLLGHAANELTVLKKLLVLAGNEKVTGGFVDDIHTYQTLIILRLLIGKLHETWKLFKIHFMEKKNIAIAYRACLSNDANNAIDQLKRDFAPGNPLTDIRDETAFHAPTADDIEASFQALPKSDPWYFFLSDQMPSFYLASELIVMRSVLNKVSAWKSPDQLPDDVAFRELCNVVTAVSGRMAFVIDECIKSVVGAHFKREPRIEAEVQGMPSLDSLSLPFYIEPAK